jgi:nucleoside-diphosphate-sugar epimerase
MNSPANNSFIAGPDDLILVTGASGFIGARVINSLLKMGFRNLRCLTRPSSKMDGLHAVIGAHEGGGHVEVLAGNLLSTADCATVAKGVTVVFHLAAGKGEKSFPDAFLNSVVTTRNLLDACAAQSTVRRFVNMSSFAVYTNEGKPQWGVLDENCPIEEHPETRFNSYCFAKTEQDKLVTDYGTRFSLPYVLIRPGWVYGPGAPGIHGRVGTGTFGIFLHMGGGNTMPLTYVDNCADATVLAGLTQGVDGEVFNIVDDDLPTSRQFLRQYKHKVRKFASIYVPHAVSYVFCGIWERYSKWSQGQLPPAFNLKLWHVSWKRTRYSNAKLKSRLGWRPAISTSEGLRLHFEACRAGGSRA